MRFILLHAVAEAQSPNLCNNAFAAALLQFSEVRFNMFAISLKNNDKLIPCEAGNHLLIRELEPKQT